MAFHWSLPTRAGEREREREELCSTEATFLAHYFEVLCNHINFQARFRLFLLVDFADNRVICYGGGGGGGDGID